MSIYYRFEEEGDIMSSQSKFDQMKKNHFKTLKQYVPVVAKVHGAHHPEFHEVHKIFDTIIKKTQEAGTKIPELSDEFAKLRDVTDNYAVPGDVCESYEAVYRMLSELDEAYAGRDS